MAHFRVISIKKVCMWISSSIKDWVVLIINVKIDKIITVTIILRDAIQGKRMKRDRKGTK